MANYLRHREKKTAAMRAYHAAHREEFNAVSRAWHAAHRDEENARRLALHHANKEEANLKRQNNLLKQRATRPWELLIKSAEERARRKNVPFNLTHEWAVANWTGKCAITDVEFVLGQRGSGPKSLSPSIDRIKPSLGYVPENCRFVLWAINAFKGEGNDALMFHIAARIVKSPLFSMA